MKAGIKLGIIINTTILVLATVVTALFFVRHQYYWLLLTIPIVIYEVSKIYNNQKKLFDEVAEFSESVRYRDFSRRYGTRHNLREIADIHQGFNDINEVFRDISQEKERQNLYLKRIVEIVDTGLLSYDKNTGDILWINEAFKNLVHIPYLKNISSLERRNKELYNLLMTLKPGESKLFTLHFGLETVRLMISVSTFVNSDEQFILIGFQDVNRAIDETETDAWRKLLSVMTHEIMNSVAPITSLAATLQNRFQHPIRNGEDEQDFKNDIKEGINTIRSRSESLLKFAETYRSLYKIAKPDIKRFYVCDLFENILNLMEPTAGQMGAELEVMLKDTGLQLDADRSLIEQVLINLVVNALEAVKDSDEKTITLSGESIENKIFLKVADTGSGISEDLREKIFIPFFTTKEKGSGIGLSLCRQIMNAHHGTLQVISEVNKGSVFTVVFNSAVNEPTSSPFV